VHVSDGDQTRTSSSAYPQCALAAWAIRVSVGALAGVAGRTVMSSASGVLIVRTMITLRGEWVSRFTWRRRRGRPDQSLENKRAR
jgi:hypothetical protein